jgi:hypothetical protein
MVSRGSARLTIVALASCALLVSIGGCSDGGPTGPESIVTGLAVDGAYYCYPDGGPWGQPMAVVGIYDADYAEHGGSAWPEDLVVTVGGSQLSYSGGDYVGPAPVVAAGEQVVLTVSDGLGTISQAVEVPYPPTGLELAGGAWDMSGLYASNTLTWQNPTHVGGMVALRIRQAGGGTGPGGGSLTGDPDLETMTVFNWQLSNYADIDSVLGEVFQVNTASFAGLGYGSAFSAYSGGWSEWPISGMRHGE